MGCITFSTALQPCWPRFYSKRIENAQVKSAALSAKELNKLNGALISKIPGHKVLWKRLCTPVSLEEEFSALQSKDFSKDEESEPETSPEEDLERPPDSEELKALLADSQRSKLIKKLSEANQQNRFFKRQSQVKEDALFIFKSELAVVELEIQALVNLAQEIANYNIPEGSRKINGKNIQSHLLSRLEECAGHGLVRWLEPRRTPVTRIQWCAHDFLDHIDA